MGRRTQFSAIEARRFRELGAAIEEVTRSGREGAPYARLVSTIAHELGATRFTVHRPSAGPDGWELEFKTYWSRFPGAAAEMAVYESRVRAGRTPWMFDPRVPEARQRNRVLLMQDFARGRPQLRELADATRIGSGFQAQARVLVCAGPRLLAFVAGFRDVAFDERDRAVLSALVPALRRAHVADRAARDRAFLTAAVDAALEVIAEPAFLLDRAGKIRHASKTGEAWLARTPRSRELVAEIAHGTGDLGTARPLPDGNGTVVVVRTTGLAPSARLLRAMESWNLTRRQAEVLAHAVGGATNKEIAVSLRCTEGNVELHVTNILRASGCTNRAELLSRFWNM